MDYVCTRCGATWPEETVKHWGEGDQPQTHGLGPEPRCPAILKDRKGSGYVCKGELVAQGRLDLHA